MKTEKEKKYWTKVTLKKERGWTDLLIKRFLPTPDLITDNPHYKCASPMNLYLIEKVNQIEQTPEFKVMFDSARIRKQTANKAVTTKRNQILKYISGLKIDLPLLEKEKLIDKAIKSYNEFKSWKSYERYDYEFEPATKDDDEDFLNRICTNYLRHQCTRYENELGKIFGKVGTDDAYKLLKEKINKTILEKYPYLIYTEQESLY